MATGQYSIPYGRSRADAIYTDAMSRMYGLVALGVVVTAAAIWVGDAIGAGEVIFSLGFIGILLFFGVVFGTLFAANAVVQRGNIGLGTPSTWPLLAFGDSSYLQFSCSTRER